MRTRLESNLKLRGDNVSSDATNFIDGSTFNQFVEKDNRN